MVGLILIQGWKWDSMCCGVYTGTIGSDNRIQSDNYEVNSMYVFSGCGWEAVQLKVKRIDNE